MHHRWDAAMSRNNNFWGINLNDLIQSYQLDETKYILNGHIGKNGPYHQRPHDVNLKIENPAGISKKLLVRVGVHQGSVLSLLLVNLVMQYPTASKYLRSCSTQTISLYSKMAQKNW